MRAPAPRRARDRSVAALSRVGIPDAHRRLDAYPHEFSGGMRQRVAIAIALLHRPDVIVCDEPTTALDVSIQAQILTEMKSLVRDLGTALIWISHDLATVSSLASRVLVMYAGRIIEEGPTAAVLRSPVPSLHARACSTRSPRAARRGATSRRSPARRRRCMRLPEGCAFRPRCPRATETCRSAAATRADRRAGLPLSSSAGRGGCRVSSLRRGRGRIETVHALAVRGRADCGGTRQRRRNALGTCRR